MGAAIAKREKTTSVSNTPKSKRALMRELSKYQKKLEVEKHLVLYGHALLNVEEVETQNADYFLLELNPNSMRIKITGYPHSELNRASDDYLAVERDSHATGVDAVLVSVDSMDALRRAYPNYFLDTHAFIAAVRRAIKFGD